MKKENIITSILIICMVLVTIVASIPERYNFIKSSFINVKLNLNPLEKIVLGDDNYKIVLDDIYLDKQRLKFNVIFDNVEDNIVAKIKINNNFNNQMSFYDAQSVENNKCSFSFDLKDLMNQLIKKDENSLSIKFTLEDINYADGDKILFEEDNIKIKFDKENIPENEVFKIEEIISLDKGEIYLDKLIISPLRTTLVTSSKSRQNYKNLSLVLNGFEIGFNNGKDKTITAHSAYNNEDKTYYYFNQNINTNNLKKTSVYIKKYQFEYSDDIKYTLSEDESLPKHINYKGKDLTIERAEWGNERVDNKNHYCKKIVLRYEKDDNFETTGVSIGKEMLGLTSFIDVNSDDTVYKEIMTYYVGEKKESYEFSISTARFIDKENLIYNYDLKK